MVVWRECVEFLLRKILDLKKRPNTLVHVKFIPQLLVFIVYKATAGVSRRHTTSLRRRFPLKIGSNVDLPKIDVISTSLWCLYVEMTSIMSSNFTPLNHNNTDAISTLSCQGVICVTSYRVVLSTLNRPRYWYVVKLDVAMLNHWNIDIVSTTPCQRVIDVRNSCCLTLKTCR